MLPQHPDALGGETNEVLHLKNFRSWVIDKMPVLNNDALAKKVEPDVFIPPIQFFVDSFPNIDSLTTQQARDELMYLGFAISSLERHAQDRGLNAGDAMNQIRNVTPILLKLGIKLGHPPRDSLYTFATWNKERISFTADPQEVLFIDIVDLATRHLDDAAKKVRQITTWEIPFSDSAKTIVEAKASVDKARQQFLRYFGTTSTGEKAYTPEFFLDIMRQYQCNWVIDGEVWGPPTAANCVPQFQLDYLVGTLMPGYREHLLSRSQYFTTEDQEALLKDMDGTSLFAMVETQLGYPEIGIGHVDTSTLRNTLSKLPIGTQQAILETEHLAQSAASLSALHWSLIQNFMGKPLKARGDAERAKEGRAVDNTKGTSGMEFPQLQAIRDMRRKYPDHAKLAEVFNL